MYSKLLSWLVTWPHTPLGSGQERDEEVTLV